MSALLLYGSSAGASEESVDRRTQVALGLDANRQHGGRLFLAQCASCHGHTGQGQIGATAGATGQAHAIPALAGQRFAYVVRQLANFSGAERDNATMHGVVMRQSVQTPQAWADVAAYVSRLPPNPTPETGDGKHVALGRGIFHEQCASCHHADAGGDRDGLVPALRGQHYSYLTTQLRQLAAANRHNMDPDLVRFLKSFNDQDVDAVADYLSRQQSARRDHQTMRDDGTVVD